MPTLKYNRQSYTCTLTGPQIAALLYAADCLQAGPSPIIEALDGAVTALEEINVVVTQVREQS